MMDVAVSTIRAEAAAKLNLTFDVLKKRLDGFHNIHTIFQSIDLTDTLDFKFTRGGSGSSGWDNWNGSEERLKLSLTLNAESAVGLPDGRSTNSTTVKKPEAFPLTGDNLILKAARQFSQVSGHGNGVEVEVIVNKKIPIAAGMAGGSSNAAATLAVLNNYFGNPFNDSELMGLATKIGSDVAFCLQGGTCLGTGRGEKLKKISHTNTLDFLIVKPRAITISTPWIYMAYDDWCSSKIAAEKAVPAEADQNKARSSDSGAQTEALIAALSRNDLSKLPRYMHNAFEPVVFAEHPEVKMLRDSMLRLGCLSANITGSGPTLYGLVQNRQSGAEVKATLLAEYAGTEDFGAFDCWLTQSVDQGIILSIL